MAFQDGEVSLHAVTAIEEGEDIALKLKGVALKNVAHRIGYSRRGLAGVLQLLL